MGNEKLLLRRALKDSEAQTLCTEINNLLSAIGEPDMIISVSTSTGDYISALDLVMETLPDGSKRYNLVLRLDEQPFIQ